MLIKVGDHLPGGLAVGDVENRQIVYSRDLVARQDDRNVGTRAAASIVLSLGMRPVNRITPAN